MLLENDKKFYYTSLLKTIFLICFLFILTSCGEDTCFIDLHVGKDGTAFSNKIGKPIDISAKESTGVSTGVVTDQFTVSVSGVTFMCTDDKYDMNRYSTTCRDGNKEICTDQCSISADSKQLDTDLRNCWSGCDSANQKISGICQPEDFICINGKKWTVKDKRYDVATKTWIPLPPKDITFEEDDSGCGEEITCSANGDKIYHYSTGNPPTAAQKKIGTCPPVPNIHYEYVSNNPPLVHGCFGNYMFMCPSNITSSTYTGDQRWQYAFCMFGGRGLGPSISTKLCKQSQNNIINICLNDNMIGIQKDTWKFTGNLGPCDDAMGYQRLTCDKNGNEFVHFEDANGGNKTSLISTGRHCSKVSGSINDLQKYKVQLDASNNTWIEIGNNILSGDILKFSINGPIDAPPNALFRDQNTPYPADNSTINRWVQNKNQYAEAYKEGDNCPGSLKYNQSISNYPQCNALKSLPQNMQGYKEDEQSVWNILGKGIVLQSSPGDSCPTDSSCSSNYFVSEGSSNFGVVTILTNKDKNGKEDMSKSSSFYIERDFVSKQKLGKICAKICDTRGADKGYKDNLGGYTLNVEKSSCVAVAGNPSPCCSDGRGVLEYKFGDGPWTAVAPTSKKFIDKVPPSNTNQTFGPFSSKKAQNLSFRIRIASTKEGASGKYTLSYTYREQLTKTKGISTIIEWIKDFMRHIFFGNPDGKTKYEKDGLLKKYFKNIANGDVDGYMQYISLLLLLYIVLYGLAFLVGYVEISQKDLIIRILKIGVVLTLISPNGYTFLHDHFFQLFIDGSDALICRSNFVGGCSKGSNTFGFVDHALTFLLYNKPTWLKILSLLMSSPIGIIFVIFYFIGIIYFLIGVMSAAVAYLMCILAVAVLIFISPVFIPFILFEKTSYLFHNWLKLLVRYTLEPVMLVIGLQILVSIFYAVFINSIDFTVCWKCMIPINFGAIGPIKDFLTTISVTTSVFCLPFFGPWGYYGAGGMLFGGLGILLPNLILLVIIAKLIRDYHEFITIMLDSFIGQSPSILGKGRGGGTSGAASFVKGKLGVGRVEEWSGKKLRGGIARVTGVKFRTKQEVEQEKIAKNEAAKTRGLRSFGVDLEERKFRSVLSNLPKTDKLKNDLRKGGEDGDKAASKLGGTMFKNLSNDQLAYKGFINGMRSLREMKKADVDKLKPDVQELHNVLNSHVVKGSFDDLESKNKDVQDAAMTRIGKHMFKNNNLRDALLDDKKGADLSKKVFEIGRS